MRRYGFTAIEFLVICSMLVILTGIVFTSFSSFKHSQALDNDIRLIITTLEEARAKTLASKDASQFGVRFSNSKFTLFKGSSFNASDPENQTFDLDTFNTITTISLTGGGSDVIFARLTGETTQSGTLTISSNKTSEARTITVYKTGIVETN
jgi:Tfp pilus assembly protein FimT